MTDLYTASRAAEQAAYAVGTHLQASRSRLAAVVVTNQTPREVTRAVELEARELVREVLCKQFPEHTLVCSEKDEGAFQSPLISPHWVVDALNGRENYQRSHAQYAVSIALFEGGVAQVGVVYDPNRNEFFGAIRGHGAVLNGQSIRCAPARPLTEALATTVPPLPNSQCMSTYAAEFGRVLLGFSGLRRSGSMALELAHLAAGRVDAFWQLEHSARGAAAASLLLEESGALIETRDGLPLLSSRELMACTPELRGAFLAMLNAEVPSPLITI